MTPLSSNLGSPAATTSSSSSKRAAPQEQTEAKKPCQDTNNREELHEKMRSLRDRIQVLNALPDSDANRKALSVTLASFAKCEYEIGKFNEASKTLDWALLLDPNNSNLLLLSAQTRVADILQKKLHPAHINDAADIETLEKSLYCLDSAIQLNRALEKSSLFPHICHLRGAAKHYLGRDVDALADLNKALATTCEKTARLPLLRFRGAIRTRLEDFRGASEDFHACLEQKPDDPLAKLAYEKAKNAFEDQQISFLHTFKSVESDQPAPSGPSLSPEEREELIQTALQDERFQVELKILESLYYKPELFFK